MQCELREHKLSAYFDGEMATAEKVAFQRHMATCSSCSDGLQQFMALRGMMRNEMPVAPDGLAARIISALADESEAEVQPTPALPRWHLPRYAAPAATYAAVAALAGALGYGAMQRPMLVDIAAHDVNAAHVRALMQEAPYQVASSDQHTVKPWFAGRTEFSPQVRDFAAQGFVLAGGRLDYVDGKRVAALVYRHDRHVIDLFMWPSSSANTAPQFSMSDGFHLATWVVGGLEARAISDMGADEMKAFAALASTP